MSNKLNEYIKDKLDIKNVGPQILEKTNTLIQEAIWELKKNQVIPAVTLEFQSIDKKEEKRNSKGELEYNFYFLPEDFGTLEEFYVDEELDEPQKRIPYQHTVYENYISSANTNNRRKFFSVADITLGGENRKVIVANPFPENNTIIRIKYFENGTETIAERIDKRYWKLILREIEGELNLRDPEAVRDERNAEISRSKNQQGKREVNKTRPKVKGTFFKGRTDIGGSYKKKYYN